MIKAQDLAFVALVCILVASKKPSFVLYAGLASLVLSIPLFAGWVFFTAERLTWYSASFFLMYLLLPWTKLKITR